MGCRLGYVSLAALISALQVAAQLEPSIAPSYFAPSSVMSPILLPNPSNATCRVLIFRKELNSTKPAQQGPTTSPVASSVTSALDFQCENLNATALPNFGMAVELPLNVLITNATYTGVGPPTAGMNGTSRYQLNTQLSLPADATASAFINTTVLSTTEDVLPRNIYINGSRCALAVAGFNNPAVPPASDLFANLRPSAGSVP